MNTQHRSFTLDPMFKTALATVRIALQDELDSEPAVMQDGLDQSHEFEELTDSLNRAEKLQNAIAALTALMEHKDIHHAEPTD